MAHTDDRDRRDRTGRRGSGRRPAGPGGHGPAATRRALRREAPSTVAVVADAAGFTAMRRYRTFAFADHHTYLRQTEGLLRSLTAQGIHTRVGLFDPADYEHFCVQERIDPDTPDSRTRYVAEVAATGATVRYRGQPIGRLLPLLLDGWERQDTWERATELLAGLGPCTDCGEDIGAAALDEAARLLVRITGSAGPGTHHLVCSVTGETGPLVAVLHTGSAPRGAPAPPAPATGGGAAEELVFRAVLAAGIATERPGGVVMRTVRGGGEDGGEEVRGWSLTGGRLRPLSEAEVFSAYCTDARTGEPVPPEPGLLYRAGFPLSRPGTADGPNSADGPDGPDGPEEEEKREGREG
ncbi:hypothetical protein V1L54_27835 [Streptomyces sp. TRM 70361]|uniref:hypothetical protein n=1 Tax=Streptomyces sp. TRM 70361 TaxID=3116553 RepID=UPI002E7BEC6C|nr:hypothetical protein [Streptomyces sp. TRM 70361]MEE1943168.1 hypothetical protein [Streptomyces sp. TRM 70361]